MRPPTDIAGIRFGNLVPVRIRRRIGKRPLWLCFCDCGGAAFATNGELRSGRRSNCGECARKSAIRGRGKDCHNYKHGGAPRGSHTKEYRTWASMIRRCELPSQRSYPLYGGAGITVSPLWRHDFARFFADVGPAPSEKHSLDRWPNNAGNYEPGNVRWATSKQQGNNTSVNVHVECGGRTQTVAEWAEEIGIKYQTLWARLFVRKWSPERALRP